MLIVCSPSANRVVSSVNAGVPACSMAKPSTNNAKPPGFAAFALSVIDPFTSSLLCTPSIESDPFTHGAHIGSPMMRSWYGPSSD